MPPRPSVTQEIIVQRSNRELQTLYESLVDALEGIRNYSLGWEAVYPILASVRHLEADARIAGVILGMLSPWIPVVGDVPPGAPQDIAAPRSDRIDLAVKALADILPEYPLSDGDRYRWPQIEDAIRWIHESGISSREELARVQVALHSQVFFDGAVEDAKAIERLRQAVAESYEKGESFATFRKRIEGTVDLTRNKLETVFRTNTKRAFLAGQDRALQTPRVARRFRWLYYAATKDNRVRPWHWFFDGWVVENNTPEADLVRQVQGEFSCRCALIPVDESMMREYGGVKTMADVPPAILDQIRLDAYQGDR